MKPTYLSRTLLATALAGAFALTASAQTTGTSAKEQELEAARMQLQQSAKRVAELSRELGRPAEGLVVERRLLSKPVLGVLLESDDVKGVRVSGVTPDSGAAKAGLRSGDRIVSIDGKAVSGATGTARIEQLRKMLDGLKEGSAIRVGYERDGRAATASVTPAKGAPVALFDSDSDGAGLRGPLVRRFKMAPEGGTAGAGERVVGIHRALGEAGADGDAKQFRVIRHDVRGGPEGDTHEFEFAGPGIAPQVHREVIRLARDPQCKDGNDCRTVALAEAFRWNGLNLATIDAQLGRYFGATDGVLVVSAGPELVGLQSGDVIRRVDGKPVTTPREVMDVLRAKPEGAMVGVDYLRDRKAGSAQIRAPKAMRIPLPPKPPAPPAPPAADAPPAPPAPPAPAGVAAAKHAFGNKGDGGN